MRSSISCWCFQQKQELCTLENCKDAELSTEQQQQRQQNPLFYHNLKYVRECQAVKKSVQVPTALTGSVNWSNEAGGKKEKEDKRSKK